MSHGFSTGHVRSTQGGSSAVLAQAKTRKRAKHVFGTGEIPHLWAHKVQDSARNARGNLYFENDTIFSYGGHFPIGLEHGIRRLRHFVNDHKPKLKEALAAILQREGYIDGFSVGETPGKPGQVLTVRMKYSPERQRTISGIQRISKPGLRVYRGADKLPRVLGGLGVAVLSTSQGLMTDTEARQRKVGGEILCYVW